MAVLRPSPQGEPEPGAGEGGLGGELDPFGSPWPGSPAGPAGVIVEPDDASARRARPSDAPTDSVRPGAPNDRPGWHVRLFGSREFFRLWLVMVASATGDWLGLAALIALATRIYDDANAAAAAISLVVSVRLLPGFFFAPLAGVFVDRWDRKKVMVTCDLGRAVVLVLLPFVDDLAGLVLASLALEVLTLLWTPAKDATTPNLVPADHLATANSLSMAAGYGTFPLAQLLFAALAGLSALLGRIDALAFLGLNQTALAFYVDAATFLFAAAMIWRLPIGRAAPKRRRSGGAGPAVRQALQELREGWHQIFINPTVRTVNLGMGLAFVAGGMLIPLGSIFATDVLGAGEAGYGLFTTALGLGVAAGVAGVSTLQRRLPKDVVFSTALVIAGAALFAGASASSLGVSALFVAVLGAAVGPVYVVGLALIQQEVDDELRGRVLAGFNTLVRLSVFASITFGPLLAAFLGSAADRLVDGELGVGSYTIAVPGARLALWAAAAILLAAGLMTRGAVRRGARREAAGASGHPSGAGGTRDSSP